MPPREEVILVVLKEEPSLLDATKLVKPAGLRVIGREVISYFRRNKAWLFETHEASKSSAERAGKVAQANLISKTILTASDPYLHQLDLYVTYQDGWVKLEGILEKPKNTEKADLKHKILLAGKAVFGERGIKISGGEGNYTLELLPVRKELRGKVRPAKVSAETLEGIQELLDKAIKGVSPLTA
jgi:hypothetical protein